MSCLGKGHVTTKSSVCMLRTCAAANQGKAASYSGVGPGQQHGSPSGSSTLYFVQPIQVQSRCQKPEVLAPPLLSG